MELFPEALGGLLAFLFIVLQMGRAEPRAWLLDPVCGTPSLGVSEAQIILLFQLQVQGCPPI